MLYLLVTYYLSYLKMLVTAQIVYIASVGWKCHICNMFNNWKNQPCCSLCDYIFLYFVQWGIERVPSAWRCLCRAVKSFWSMTTTICDADGPPSLFIFLFCICVSFHRDLLTHTLANSNALFVLFCLLLFLCFPCTLMLPDIFSHPGKNLCVIYYTYTVLLTTSVLWK